MSLADMTITELRTLKGVRPISFVQVAREEEGSQNGGSDQHCIDASLTFYKS